jgi:hypothetical protein
MPDPLVPLRPLKYKFALIKGAGLAGDAAKSIASPTYT